MRSPGNCIRSGRDCIRSPGNCIRSGRDCIRSSGNCIRSGRNPIHSSGNCIRSGHNRNKLSGILIRTAATDRSSRSSSMGGQGALRGTLPFVRATLKSRSRRSIPAPDGGVADQIKRKTRRVINRSARPCCTCLSEACPAVGHDPRQMLIREFADTDRPGALSGIRGLLYEGPFAT